MAVETHKINDLFDCRANRAENYALLERMRSLANRNNVYQGPPPVNLLEKQFQVFHITNSLDLCFCI